MNDRDRLAADLAANALIVSPAPEVLADRLIALGWTRLDIQTAELLDALYGMNIYSAGDLHARPLDEERLARALEAGIPLFEQPPQPWSVYLPAIAKAYREDTE